MNLSKKNFVNVDPLDPKRMIVQGEDLFAFTRSTIFSVHTISKDSPDMKKYDEALEQFYKWYPVLSQTFEPRSDGHFYYKKGLIKPINFANDIKNNEVIRTKAEFNDMLSKEYADFFHSKYVFGPKMYKVDVAPGYGDSFINDKLGYVMIVPAYHLITDGKSHKVLRNFLNGYFKDKSHKPRLSSPQTCVNNPNVLIPENIEPKIVKDIEMGEYQTIGWDKHIREDRFKRGLSIEMRKFPKTELRHPKGTSLTATLASIQLFMYTSLLLDYHTARESVGTVVLCPYTMDYTGFKSLMDGNHEDLCGNDIGLARTFQKVSREAPRTLYETIKLTKAHHDLTRKNITQNIVNQRYGPFLDSQKTPGYEKLNNIVTNVGDNKLIPGPLVGLNGFTFMSHHIGCVQLSFTGQNDGNIMFAAASQKTSFCNRFLRVYQDLFIKLGQISEKRDITRDELVTMPEYKELLELLTK